MTGMPAAQDSDVVHEEGEKRTVVAGEDSGGVLRRHAIHEVVNRRLGGERGDGGDGAAVDLCSLEIGRGLAYCRDAGRRANRAEEAES